MASPHAAGAAALYYGAHRDASARKVIKVLQKRGPKDTLTDVGEGTVNPLLFTKKLT